MTALAPVVSFGLALGVGWRQALVTMGVAGLVALAALWSQRGILTSQRSDPHARAVPGGSAALLRQPSILLCFAFFCVLTTATVGLQTFLPTALHAAFDVPIGWATSAVSTYLLGGTAGILAGGFLAGRFARHDRVATAGLGTAALTVLSIALFAPPQVLLLPLLALVGFALGSTGPSRDLIVRNATPKGAAGRVYGSRPPRSSRRASPRAARARARRPAAPAAPPTARTRAPTAAPAGRRAAPRASPD